MHRPNHDATMALVAAAPPAGAQREPPVEAGASVNRLLSFKSSKVASLGRKPKPMLKPEADVWRC